MLPNLYVPWPFWSWCLIFTSKVVLTNHSIWKMYSLWLSDWFSHFVHIASSNSRQECELCLLWPELHCPSARTQSSWMGVLRVTPKPVSRRRRMQWEKDVSGTVLTLRYSPHNHYKRAFLQYVKAEGFRSSVINAGKGTEIRILKIKMWWRVNFLNTLKDQLIWLGCGSVTKH